MTHLKIVWGGNEIVSNNNKDTNFQYIKIIKI